MFPEGVFLLDHIIGISVGAKPHQLLRRMELVAKDGQHIHTGQGFALQESSDVVAADLDTRGFFHGQGARLVGRLVQHGGEAEKLPVAGLVDHHLLVIFVDSRDLYVARYQDVSVFAGIAYFVDPLPRNKCSKVDLGGQDGNFIIVEQGKQRDVF